LLFYVPAMLVFALMGVGSEKLLQFKLALATLGGVAVWRYSWQAVHLARAIYYLTVRFPRLRARAQKFDVRNRPIFVVITSFRIAHQTTIAVYRALFQEVSRHPGRSTIVAAITDPADEHILRHLLEPIDEAGRVDLVIMYQSGAGKRVAMAEALRAVARRMPSPDAVVALMDGDVILERGIFAKCLPFFALSSRLGALTVNNRAIAKGAGKVDSWYALRFAQRHLYMSSASLSRRLLVLTGRFSLFRAQIATDPTFIRAVEADFVHHWHHGPIRLLTGDDKSTWLWVLRHKWDMLYVPNALAVSVEDLPQERFVISSIRLMNRWFGNMLRAGMGALPLGPFRIGFFTWWCLVDQRLSMWTALVGPAIAIIGAVFVTWRVLPAYLAWIMAVRLVQAGILSAVTRRFDGYYPLLLYYNQIVGALVKIHVLFRLDRQSWTRQGIYSSATSSIFARRVRTVWDTYCQGLSIAFLMLFLLFYCGVLHVPPLSMLHVTSSFQPTLSAGVSGPQRSAN
jgi:glycosyltransferase Alg8